MALTAGQLWFGEKWFGSSGRTRTYNPSVNSRMALIVYWQQKLGTSKEAIFGEIGRTPSRRNQNRPGTKRNKPPSAQALPGSWSEAATSGKWRAPTAWDVMSTRIESLSGARRVQPIDRRPEGNIDEDDRCSRQPAKWSTPVPARLPMAQEHQIVAAVFIASKVAIASRAQPILCMHAILQRAFKGGRASWFGSSDDLEIRPDS
jgi:hypothetical protein